MKKYISLIISVLLIFSTVVGATTTTDPMERFKNTKTYDEKVYNDIPANEWYVPSVKQCYELSLMMGNGDGTFNPNGNVTLAEAITMASRVNNIYMGGNGNFDTSGTNWYDNIVKYAESAGIIKKGEYVNFDKAATRAELASVFSSALPSREYDKINEADYIPDIAQDNKYFSVILKLYKAGVVIGSDEKHNFYPESNITRCEAAAIICRVAVKASRIKTDLSLKKPTPVEKPEKDDKVDLEDFPDQNFEELPPEEEFNPGLPSEEDDFDEEIDPEDDYNVTGSDKPLFEDVEEKPWVGQYSESRRGDIVYTIKDSGIHNLEFVIFGDLDKELNFDAVRIGYANMDYKVETPSFIGKDITLSGEYTKVGSSEELTNSGEYYTEAVVIDGVNCTTVSINFADVDVDAILSIEKFENIGESAITLFIMAMDSGFCEGSRKRYIIINKLDK